MRQVYRVFVAVTAAGIVLSSAINASASVIGAPGPTPAPSASPVGSAPTVPVGARAAGAAPLDEQVSFDVVLRPRDQPALDAFVSAVSTPGSSQYRQFLGSGEFAARFGPTPSSVATVSTRLRSLGLDVGAAQGSLLPVTGSLSTLTAAFHTNFVRYRLASGRLARANVAAPQLPADIAGDVQAIVGLDDLAQFTHPLPKNAMTPAIGPRLSGPAACNFLLSNQVGNNFYTAPDLASYYGLNSAYTAGSRGAGMNVAVVELEPFDSSDIAQYQSCYGTSTTVTTTNVDGGPGYSGPGSGESALDIEDIVGLAPDAAIQVYQAPNRSSGVLDLYQAIATDNSTQVVSTSWGLCEAAASPSFVAAENTIFVQMMTQRQTVFAASGDAGSADCDSNPPPNAAPNSSTALAVDDPASQPTVTGVGGTDLTTATGPETTWNDGIVTTNGVSSVSAGGGGVSANWQMPTWQTTLGTIAGSSRIPCGASVASLCREVPDVSASADPNHGYAVFVAGQWYLFGGTSAAAPTWAALLTLVDASCGGHRLGLINPTLYQLRAAGTTDFNDVTSGTNDGAGVNGGTYGALTGYDMASGLGTPIGATLSSGLCPVPASNGVGTVTTDHPFVPASSSTTVRFIYHAPNGNRLTNGKLSLVVPTGWSAPSTTAGTPGYTTASAGTVSVAGSTINVTGVTTAADATFTVTYGDPASSGPGAMAPSSQQVSTFNAQEASTSGGTLTAAGPAPQIAVGQAPDGSGTMTVSPTSVQVTTPTTLTFTYRPPAGATTTNGVVTVVVPTGWTAPSTTSNVPGFVKASTGTLTLVGRTIHVAAVSLPVSGLLTITYGDTSGGANPGATATPPSSPGPSTFATQEQSTSGGALISLASSPVVNVVPAGGGGGGGGAAPTGATLTRVSGDNRVATSVAASQTAFPAAKSATAVVLARADAFADALAGTPLAVSKGAPLLLTGSAALDPAASAEIQRALEPGGAVYLLGGTSALSANVASSVVALGHPIVRIAGPDRFATAVDVAAALGAPAAIFEADGTNFPDALSAGTAAAQAGGVVLLTAGSTQSAATAAYLAAHSSVTRYGIGGPAAAADRTARSFVGTDRFGTSVLVAQAFFSAPVSVGLASGVSFPDALAGGSVAGMNHGPMVLVPSSGALPASVRNYLASIATSVTAAWLFGGTSSVGADVFSAASTALVPAA